ncbi:FAD binding domain-containing protein [Bradyrhizobium elkanii]|uniref:FAD binding domain-containing protein n=1 Tax=Bradyrhizobium elkanii TaxID=29448 RepID=UPI00209E823B|nr:xanthine dehydrogenase family protein subunit M [Bradyrhizobium elkanii]MCP1968529.1 carbon-monoxide dehydrogenase medium subunit [Bradyrhizobium elkanii]MCS4109970.1 carbon-monoxide dehydrogenase medium subunit [Bradyrhizobium elkanii]
MIPAAFDYVRASSLTQAIEFLRDNPDGARLLAGGHTLIPALKLRLASPELLIDIRSLAEIKGIEVGETHVKIGALTTHSELSASEPLNEIFPIFRETASVLADPQVRNRGTIGGSLANADPAADWPAVVLALRAQIEIAGATGRRSVPAEEFFLDIFSTALEPDEILASIQIPKAKTGTRYAYRKIRHPASGFAVVGIAIAMRMLDGVVEEASIGVTGATNHAFVGRDAVEFLTGKALTRDNIDEAARMLSEKTECLSDRYAPAEYRANLVRVELGRALLEFSQ